MKNVKDLFYKEQTDTQMSILDNAVKIVVLLNYY